MHYAFAAERLREFAEATGIPVAYTQSGVGSMEWDHELCLGAIGSTGSTASNAYARDADVILGIGTRYEDFTTASKTAFQNPDVRFVNVNIAGMDAYKAGASVQIVADAGKTLPELQDGLSAAGFRLPSEAAELVRRERARWNAAVDESFSVRHQPLPAQTEIIGAVNAAMDDRDVVVCAAGSLPGDLHKLWRVRDPYGYHVEYAFSCMGYEIAGGLGVKRAALHEALASAGSPDGGRDVVVMVGDGSYLMMHTELVTAVAEGTKLIVVLLQNHGFASIGSLSESVGSERFGTKYRYAQQGTPPTGTGRLFPSILPPTPHRWASACCAWSPAQMPSTACGQLWPRRRPGRKDPARSSSTSTPTCTWTPRTPSPGGTCRSPTSQSWTPPSPPAPRTQNSNPGSVTCWARKERAHEHHRHHTLDQRHAGPRPGRASAGGVQPGDGRGQRQSAPRR